MPNAMLIAPMTASGAAPRCSAPKATPTASPSGILCSVIARMSRTTRFAPLPLSDLQLTHVTTRSDAQRKTAPSKKPSVATSHGGRPSCSAARAMAGCSRDQKLAAIMTPAEKPSIRFIASGDGLRNRNTVAAPAAVTAHVPSVAISAQTIGFSIFHLPFHCMQ